MVNDSQDSLVPTTEVAISAAFLCVVNIGIIIGNFLALIVVWRTSKLHEPNYFFLCNLSVADLLVGMIYCPLLMASVIKQSWVFGNPLCCAHSVIVSASLNASLMNLCAISVDRYFFITRPLRYTEIVTPRRTFITIALVWFHSIFWAIAPIFGWGQLVYEGSTATCKPNWNGEGLGDKSYALSLGLVCFLVPVLIMILAYSMIYKAARKQLQNMQIPGLTKEQSMRRNKATKTVLIIIGMFCLCWSVYTLVSVWKLFAVLSDLPPRLVRIGLYLAVSNSCMNFYVYAIRDKVFRKGLRNLFFPHRSFYHEQKNRSNELSRTARTMQKQSLAVDSLASRKTFTLQTTV